MPPSRLVAAAGGDAYVLRAVLHDWDDADAVAILRNCRAAMRDDATLLIIERDLGPANELPGPKFSDLNMLVGVGGQERTIDQYAQLMRQAGLRFIANTPGAFDLHIIEGAPA
jgi:O-methyltransferase domain